MNAGIMKNSLPHERAQLFIQYQMVSTEIYIQVTLYILIRLYLYIQEYMCVYVCMYVYAYVHVTTINEKEAMNMNEWKQGYMRNFGGRKGKEEMMQFYYNLKK